MLEGAAVVHIHMRDEEGHPTMRVDLFEKTIQLIREKCDVILNMTSSGGHSLDGISRSHMPTLLATLALGGHVRVGLEDNVYYSKGVLAESNAQLVRRAASIIREAGYEVATPAEAREILGIRK